MECWQLIVGEFFLSATLASCHPNMSEIKRRRLEEHLEAADNIEYCVEPFMAAERTVQVESSPTNVTIDPYFEAGPPSPSCRS